MGECTLKLMISVTNLAEASAAVEGGAEIIDVKNPAEGSLGANYPWVIKDIRNAVPEALEVSATLGDAANLPGTYALAAAGAAICQINYVKVGLHGFTNESEAVFFLERIREAIRFCAVNTKLMVAGYADLDKKLGIQPESIPKIASEVGAVGCMLDTYYKKEGNLFDKMKMQQLWQFVEASHGAGLICALAGSIELNHLSLLRQLQVDIVGMRGAACEKEQRLGKICAEKVKLLRETIQDISVPKVVPAANNRVNR